MQEYKSFFGMMGMRFLRGFVAGAVGSVTMLTAGSPDMTVLANPKLWLFAVISGGISGACLAIDKWIRSDGSNYK